MILMKLLTSSSATVDALARAIEKGGYYDTPHRVPMDNGQKLFKGDV